MNSPVSRIETLDHQIERWAAMISACLAITLAGILLRAQNALHAVRDLVRYGPQVQRRLQFNVQLSQPMMAKLETLGRHCELFRRKAHTLPAAVSPLYASVPPRVADATKLELIGTRLRMAVTDTPLVETGFAQDLRHVSGTIEQFIARSKEELLN